jgi:hypothetical protein
VRIGQLGREGRRIWKGRESRGEGWVRGLGIGRGLGEGGREREKNNFLKVKNIILMI